MRRYRATSEDRLASALPPLVLMISCLALVVLVGQQKSESSGAGPESQKVVEAAIAFAKGVSAEGTPEYTSALKKAIALASGLPISEEATRAIVVPMLLPGPIDFDERYRRHFVEAQSDKQRIWGGERVPPGTYPDTVAILGNGQICTGTVIGPTTVLTAAHCFCGGVGERVIAGDLVSTPMATFTVSSGASMMKCTDRLESGDLAVLRTSSQMAIRPRTFAHPSMIAQATVARAVGFGRTENPIVEPLGVKRRVDVPIASRDCAGMVSTPKGPVADAGFYGCAPGEEMVAGARSLDKDSCNGDSGGPLFVTGADGDLYLAGATSRPTGPPGLRPCGDGGIYVRTDGRTVKWLADVGVTVAVGPPR